MTLHTPFENLFRLLDVCQPLKYSSKRIMDVTAPQKMSKTIVAWRKHSVSGKIMQKHKFLFCLANIWAPAKIYLRTNVLMFFNVFFFFYFSPLNKIWMEFRREFLKYGDIMCLHPVAK